MNEDRTIHLVEIPIGGRGGFIWNRLHGEREDTCEALLKADGPAFVERRELLHARLRKLDDALDRLMSGSYGNCSKCGRSIDDAALDTDPALAICLGCSGDELGPEDPGAGVMVGDLNAFDTVMLRTHNSDYRILLLDPKTGRALVEGGDLLTEPTEGVVMGSAIPGSDFKGGVIAVGCLLKMWFDETALLTSPVKSVQVKRGGGAALAEAISASLH